jgi:hypothetical protein
MGHRKVNQKLFKNHISRTSLPPESFIGLRAKDKQKPLVRGTVMLDALIYFMLPW